MDLLQYTHLIKFDGLWFKFDGHMHLNDFFLKISPYLVHAYVIDPSSNISLL